MREAITLSDVMDSTSTQVERHLTSLKEAQEAIEGIAKGKSFLLIDSTLGKPTDRLHRGVRKLQERGWDRLAQLYIQKLFGGALPKKNADVFQAFLGPNVRLVDHDIRTASPPALDAFDAVLFSGSPADVTKAFQNPFNEVDPGITHREMYQRALQLYRAAAKQNVPVFAVCFGHQVVTKAHGGDVFREGELSAETGMGGVTADEYGATLLAATRLGDPNSLKGDVVSFHGEAVRHRPEHSALILRSSSERPSIVHGLIHMKDHPFSGRPDADAALIASLMGEGRHAALTLQSHPESTAAQGLSRFAMTEDPEVFMAKGDKVVTADMLRLLRNFLALHKRFRS